VTNTDDTFISEIGFISKYALGKSHKINEMIKKTSVNMHNYRPKTVSKYACSDDHLPCYASAMRDTLPYWGPRIVEGWELCMFTDAKIKKRHKNNEMQI
jgi:hypothetical protein